MTVTDLPDTAEFNRFWSRRPDWWRPPRVFFNPFDQRLYVLLDTGDFIRLPTLGTQATQPISAASLPLPAGASTSALQLPAGHTVTPLEQRAATLGVTATGLVNAAVTLTLPAAGVGLFHYIVSLELVKLYSVVGVAAGAGVIVTSTNMPGTPAWTTEQLASAAGTAVKVIKEEPTTPLKSSASNTATTFVAPAQLQTIWRWNVRYFTAA